MIDDARVGANIRKIRGWAFNKCPHPTYTLQMPIAVVATQEKEKGKIEKMPNNTHCPKKKRLLNGESEMQQSTEPPPIQRPSVYTPKNNKGEKKAYTRQPVFLHRGTCCHTKKKEKKKGKEKKKKSFRALYTLC